MSATMCGCGRIYVLEALWSLLLISGVHSNRTSSSVGGRQREGVATCRRWMSSFLMVAKKLVWAR